MGRKSPAAVGERISEDGRRDLGDAAPFSTRTSSLQEKVGRLAIMLTLVELVFGPGSTRRAQKLSPRIACYVAAERLAPGLLHADPYFSSHPKSRPASCSIDQNSCPFFFISLQKVDIYPPAWVLQTDPNSSCWGTGLLPSGTVSLSFRGIIGKPRARGHQCVDTPSPEERSRILER